MLSRGWAWLRRVLGASTPPAETPTFPAVVYTTAPDPSQWMTEAERRYHLSNHHGR